MATLTFQEINDVFHGAERIQLHLIPNQNIADTLIGFGVFESEDMLKAEINAGKLIKRHGIWVNQGSSHVQPSFLIDFSTADASEPGLYTRYSHSSEQSELGSNS